MLATLRRLLLVCAGAIALSASGLAQVGADLQKTLSQADAAYGRADYVEAVRWYRSAADHGDAVAQLKLGAMYETGEGVPQNYVEAVRWFRLAADQGHAMAQFNLALMYDNGRGVPQNYAEAVRWYRLAADQGHALGQKNLGVMYVQGQGVPQNYVEAYKWWSLAAAQGDSEAAQNRDRVLGLMTPAQIAEGQKLSAAWKSKGTDN